MSRRMLVKEESCDEMVAATLNQASPAEEVQWTWKRESLQKTTTKLYLFSRRAVVKQIEEELKLIGDEVYREFLNSCFGFLMRLDTQIAGPNTALHCLFAHEVVKADAAPDELWYRVGGRLIRFSKYEYALVTGLSFGPTTFDPSAEHHPPASGLFLRHYGGQDLTMDTLRRDFTKGLFRESPDDALKVAKLLIVYFLLLGMDGGCSYIDKWAWTLIEDSDGWESFIWGNYTFQILLRHLQRLPTEFELPLCGTPSYRVYGYVWAFWIWAFEAIPELGNTYGVRTSDDVLPRGLRWRFAKNDQADMNEFYDHQMEVYSTLEPSAEEKRQPYWEHIHDDLQSGLCYVHRWDNPIKKKKKKKTVFVNPCSLKNVYKSENVLMAKSLTMNDQCRSLGVTKRSDTRTDQGSQATPLTGKRKRTDQMPVQEKPIQKKLRRIVQEELPSVIRQEVQMALRDFLSLRDSLSARDPPVGVQCDVSKVGTPVVPWDLEKCKCVDTTMVLKMGKEINDLRREKLAAIKTIDELRLKQLEADKVVEELKRKMNLSSRTVKIEEDCADMVVMAPNSTGSGSSALSKKGGNITMELSGLNDEVSTDDSGDESCTDSRMDDLIASLQSSRKWMYEADMLLALQEDEQLCMNAVCALYRQQSLDRNSKGRSKIGGFSPLDSMSGCGLAEYLIDGDKELRLRKSVSEVKKERPDVIGQCRKLATIYVHKLLQIYCAADDDDPFFGQ